MTLLYKPRAVKQLRQLPKTSQKRILKKLVALSKNPFSGKRLKGELKTFYSIRAWPYRIIYSIDGGAVSVYSIAHRQGVYR